MTRRRLFLVCLTLLLFGTRAFALEITSGKIRIDLAESSGRFIAYERTSANDWTPLFYAQDPRTTVLEVRAGQDVYRMGDSSHFKQKVEKTQSGGQISWTSNRLSVTESFRFMTSAGAAQADGFLITISLANRSTDPLSLGARYLLDTSLGEQSRIEFVTPSDGSMSNETQFQGSGVPAYWASPLDRHMTVALEQLLRAPGVTLPDRVVFANWKRLNDSRWDYTVDTSRNFNMLPYSINDSAVAVYYDPQTVQPGATRTITMLMGQYSSAGWAQPSTASKAPAPTQPSPAVTQLLDQLGSAFPAAQPGGAAPAGSTSAATRSSVVTDLKTVDSALQEIQKMLDAPGTASQSNLDVLRQVLDKLTARKTQIEQQ